MEFRDFVNRMLNDSDFRRSVKSDPEQALRDAGEEPGPDQINALNSLDFDDLEKTARAFNDASVT